MIRYIRRLWLALVGSHRLVILEDDESAVVISDDRRTRLLAISRGEGDSLTAGASICAAVWVAVLEEPGHLETALDGLESVRRLGGTQ